MSAPRNRPAHRRRRTMPTAKRQRAPSRLTLSWRSLGNPPRPRSRTEIRVRYDLHAQVRTRASVACAKGTAGDPETPSEPLSLRGARETWEGDVFRKRPSIPFVTESLKSHWRHRASRSRKWTPTWLPCIHTISHSRSTLPVLSSHNLNLCGKVIGVLIDRRAPVSDISLITHSIGCGLESSNNQAG